MDYRLAIPTYNRPATLENKTLKMLKKYNVEKKIIDLFVEDEHQYDLYKHLLPLVNNLIITNTKGVGQKHNYLRQYYKKKEINYVSIDDDVTKINSLGQDLFNFNQMCRVAFESCALNKMTLWGISKYNNKFFKSNTITKHLKCINGVLHGVYYIPNKPLIKTDFNFHSDLDFCLQSFIQDKGVIVLNYISVDTEYYGDGGIQDQQDVEERKMGEQLELELLKEMYPNLIDVDCDKFKLNWRYGFN